MLKNYKIKEIIKILLDNELLLEIYLNILNEDGSKKIYIKLECNNDGETFSISLYDGWYSTNLCWYDNVLYSKFLIDEYTHTEDISSLIDAKIVCVLVGMSPNKQETTSCHYMRIMTDKTDFLYFDSDEGHYVFNDKIKEVMLYNIYELIWKNLDTNFLSTQKD